MKPCRLFHKWSVWSATWGFGFQSYQSKSCQRCGQIKNRRVGWERMAP